MKRRHRNAVGEDKTDALRLLSGTATLKASVSGKIETQNPREKAWWAKCGDNMEETQATIECPKA